MCVQIQALQEAIKEKDQKLQLFRQHLVLSQPLDSLSLQGTAIIVLINCILISTYSKFKTCG